METLKIESVRVKTKNATVQSLGSGIMMSFLWSTEKEVAGLTGLEPAPSGLTGRRYNQS